MVHTKTVRGLGLLDLPTQLLGRKAYFTFYTLFPDLSASCHPTLHRLCRLSLQAQMYHKQNLHNIQQQIYDVMQQHISNRCQIFTIPTTFLQEHRIPSPTLHSFPGTSHSSKSTTSLRSHSNVLFPQ
jgi:hypothetical protein